MKDKNVNRIVYIDYMKCIGIFLVILGHMPITNTIVHDWIFSFHMPLFFFISGFLCKLSKDNMMFVRKNVKSLLLVILPYFIINLTFTALQDYMFYRADFSLKHNVIDKFIYTVLGKSEMGPMWFLVALFWMRITYNYLANKIKHNYIYVLTLLSVIIAWIVWISGFRINTYQLTAFLLGFPFYCIGSLFRSYSNIGCFKEYAFFILIACIAATIVLNPYSAGINLNALSLGQNFFTYYVFGVIGILLFLSLSQSMKRMKVIEVISDGTLVILGLHMIFIQIFKFLYKKICHITTTPPYMDLFSAFILSVLILIILYYPIRNILRSNNGYLRFIAGK